MYGSSTDHNHVQLENGVVSLLATRISWDEGTSGADPHLAIKYHSGAIHAKTHVIVNDQFPSWEIKGTFQAPTAKGTWPAFWLTGAQSWPPEIDILEFKGDSRNWFNTFRTSSDVSNTIVSVSNPGNWHTYRVWMSKVNSTDVDVHFYVDGVWKGQHKASGFVGKPMWIIMNLQMEGSSGSPGPSSQTWYRGKDIYVGRTRAW
jgi:hypothetical protein